MAIMTTALTLATLVLPGTLAVPPPPVAVNPLKGLPALPKYHYSWPIGADYIDAEKFDGLIVDYARITGSLAAQGGAKNATQMLAAADVCNRAAKMPNVTRTPGIGLNYGCMPGASSTGVGPGTGCNETCEANGIATFKAALKLAQANLDVANAKLGSHIEINTVQFDCETFWAGTFGSKAQAGVRRHNEAMYNATRDIFPSHDVVIVQYDYGQAEWWPEGNPSAPICNSTWAQFSHAIGKPTTTNPLPRGWCVRPAPNVYTERFEPTAEFPGGDAAFSCSLYEVLEPQLTRDRFQHTSELACLKGVKGCAVIPYISLGMAWDREGTKQHDIRQSRNTFSMHYPYNTAYSALIGAQMNLKSYENSAFGNWERAVAATFFTSAFYVAPGTTDNATEPGQLNTMRHLVAYVKGAADIA